MSTLMASDYFYFFMGDAGEFLDNLLISLILLGREEVRMFILLLH